MWDRAIWAALIVVVIAGIAAGSALDEATGTVGWVTDYLPHE